MKKIKLTDKQKKIIEKHWKERCLAEEKYDAAILCIENNMNKALAESLPRLEFFVSDLGGEVVGVGAYELDDRKKFPLIFYNTDDYYKLKFKK